MEDLGHGDIPESTSFGNWEMRVRIPSDAPLLRIGRPHAKGGGRPSEASHDGLYPRSRAGKEVNTMAELPHAELPHEELLEPLSPTVESLTEASLTLARGVPEVPGVPEAVPAAPAGSPALSIPEDDLPVASGLAPGAEPVAGAVPEVSAVLADLPAAPAEPA